MPRSRTHARRAANSRPSLRLNLAKNVWFCSPCNTGGDRIKLYQRVRGIDFPDAVRELAAA